MFGSTKMGERYLVPSRLHERYNNKAVVMRLARLCVVGIADTHPALAQGRSIARVDFNVGSKGNRNELNVTGKRKRVRRKR